MTTRKYTLTGIVQGIGFRPTALRLAEELEIKGEVKNSGGNVTIIAKGNHKALDTFLRRLVALFEIRECECEDIDDGDYDDFRIIHSTSDSRVPFITPDLATCADCERELRDSGNRRHNHMFISCVACGPRYSIARALPYDRENTTMADFALCDECEAEYTTAIDRRCHAQTIACKGCGPRASISIDEAVSLLESGEPLAIKGIGGYHLACICKSEPALRLREIKGRDSKPFAIMFRDIDEIEEHCYVSDKERELLLSPARPIVLLKKKRDFEEHICNDSDFTGAFLPCNPIQIMLLDRISPLIMTSANISGEPIITSDDEIEGLGVSVLSHNREILTPLDDSVVQINAGRVQFIRRSRGYTPLAINMGISPDEDLLCMGGDLKSTFAIVHNEYVYPSQCFGDLEDVKCLEAYKDNIERFCRLHSLRHEKIIADKHPLYYSSGIYEADRKYQHHLAHAYSVIAEHGLRGDVLSFVFDGTGYGDDAAIWGSEVFLNKKRVGHLEYTIMPASDEVAKNADLALACYERTSELLNRAMDSGINAIASSSMGRLFDAVAALLDLKHYNTFEGECAIALENCARRAKGAYRLTPSLNPREIISEIRNADAGAEELALGFHNMLAEVILLTAQKHNVKQITLSGGCFNNRILTERAIALLEENGFEVYINNAVPSGDQGIALGQAYLYADEVKENVCCSTGKDN